LVHQKSGITDKNNNIIFEGIDIPYHYYYRSSYQTHYNT